MNDLTRNDSGQTVVAQQTAAAHHGGSHLVAGTDRGRLCYLSRNYRGVESSGNKAKTDNERTLRGLGAKNLGMPTTYYNNKVATFLLDLLGIVKMVLTVRSGDVVVLQYPVKKYFSFICRVARLRGASTIALIHDLGSMRRKKLSVASEIKRLMHADKVIASNAVMAQWLRDHGYTHPLESLGLFDYYSDAQTPRRTAPAAALPTVVYAGVLAKRKNAFLLQMAERQTAFVLDVYGNKDGLPGLKESERMHLRPFMAAEEFIGGVPGDFGLVWDGDSTESCTGNFGEYLRWNSPHKVSFYLRAGLPVIVWSEAAVAGIIEQENIGFSVSSLTQLNDRLARITPQELQQMKANVARVSSKLARGGFFSEALERAMQQ